MKYALRIFVFLLIVSNHSFATNRVMVCEKFTATWSTLCPSAARGLNELYWNIYDSVVVIAYHPSPYDPFVTSFSQVRLAYYQAPGYPTVQIDGIQQFAGGVMFSTMYPRYRQYFELRKTMPSPIDINLTLSYDSVARTGVVSAKIKNISNSNIAGQLHFAVIENHIYYQWQLVDSLHYVLRTMLPNASGEAINIMVGDSITKSRNFSINPNWHHHNCRIVVFVQNNQTKEIHQGAQISIISNPRLTFARFSVSDNNNNTPEPGDTVNLTIYLKNFGTGIAENIQATLSTTNPNVTIISPTATFENIGKGKVGGSRIPYVFRINDNYTNPYVVNFELSIYASGFFRTVNFPLLVTTTPGFTDDIESGEGNWTTSGAGNFDNWHITSYRSHSDSHSWYCGVENVWYYNDENDARLISPPFVVEPNSRLRFWHYYAMELNRDFGFLEINNGSGLWSLVGIYTGFSGIWQQVNHDLSVYDGQTIQIRFRFISDFNTFDEGWYIDDIEIAPFAAINEQSYLLSKSSGFTFANPNTKQVKFNIPQSGFSILRIYDSSGKLIQILGGSNEIIWKLTDMYGQAVKCGIYFVQYGSITRKLVVTR